MHIGNGQVVSASINENGGSHGGTPGDQSGNEIKLQSYYNFPWDCVLRYTEDSSSTDPDPEHHSQLLEMPKNPGQRLELCQ